MRSRADRLAVTSARKLEAWRAWPSAPGGDRRSVDARAERGIGLRGVSPVRGLPH